MLCTFVLLATWGYSKYSGNLAEVGAAVDALATKIWDSGLQPTFNKVRYGEFKYVFSVIIYMEQLFRSRRRGRNMLRGRRHRDLNQLRRHHPGTRRRRRTLPRWRCQLRSGGSESTLSNKSRQVIFTHSDTLPCSACSSIKRILRLHEKIGKEDEKGDWYS